MKHLGLAILFVLSGCAAVAQTSGMMPNPSRDWRQVATANDRERLRDWRATFVKAVESLRKAGHSADIAREGVLLKPDAALGGGPIPNGTYRCRTVKVGGKSDWMLPYVSYPPFTCRIRAERGLQGFAKVTGSQRQVGLIFPHDQMRQVFLGTLVLGDERRAMQYGQDETRDVAGYFERIGANRWRLIMPEPHFESQLDVLELIPAR